MAQPDKVPRMREKVPWGTQRYAMASNNGVFALLFLLSCVAKKEAKKATRRMTALRVSSAARKNGRD